MEKGERVAPRGLPIRELIGTQLVIADPYANILHHPNRKANYRFMVAEWLWMQAGRNDVAFVARYNKQIEKYSDNGLTFAGAYGPRLTRQWDWLVTTLRNDPDSRQGVATIWTPCPVGSKDIPCTTQVQFFIRDGKLRSVWTMRSNDLWLGLTYDFFNFSMMTNALAATLKRSLGPLTLNVGSSHVYESNFDAVYGVLDNDQLGSYVRSPQLRRWPDASNLTELRDSIEYTEQEQQYLNVLNCATSDEALAILRSLEK